MNETLCHAGLSCSFLVPSPSSSFLATRFSASIGRDWLKANSRPSFPRSRRLPSTISTYPTQPIPRPSKPRFPLRSQRTFLPAPPRQRGTATESPSGRVLHLRSSRYEMELSVALASVITEVSSHSMARTDASPFPAIAHPTFIRLLSSSSINTSCHAASNETRLEPLSHASRQLSVRRTPRACHGGCNHLRPDSLRASHAVCLAARTLEPVFCARKEEADIECVSTTESILGESLVMQRPLSDSDGSNRILRHESALHSASLASELQFGKTANNSAAANCSARHGSCYSYSGVSRSSHPFS